MRSLRNASSKPTATRRRPVLLALVVAGIGMALACNDNALVDQNEAIRDRIWDYGNRPSIEVNITDANQPYDLFLNLRHSGKYAYSNIFVLLHQHAPNGSRDTTRVEIRLAEPDGRWTGRSSGSLFSHQQLVRSNYVFPDTGRYVFSFEQNMRENPLPEVVGVGLRIAPSE